jgi:hypothetical protein
MTPTSTPGAGTVRGLASQAHMVAGRIPLVSDICCFFCDYYGNPGQMRTAKAGVLSPCA